MGSILPAAKTEGTCFASPPPNLFSGKKKNHPIWMVLNWSRLRGSNSLPPPWQGGALPDELNLRCRQRCLLYRTAGRLSRNFFITAGLFQQTPPRPERPFPSKAGNRTTAWSENRRNLPVQFPPKAKRSPGWMTAYSGSGYERNVCDVSKSPLAALPYGRILPAAKTEGTCFASPPLESFQRQKRKATRFWVAVLEQVTRLELATSTLARWRSTR